MKRIFLLFLILPLFLSISCFPYTRDDEQVNSAFQGKYAGTFSGAYSGDVSFDIEKTGDIRGKVTYRDSKVQETIYGYVSINGKFDMNTKTQFALSGYMSDNAKGKWTKGSESGEFSFRKL